MENKREVFGRDPPDFDPLHDAFEEIDTRTEATPKRVSIELETRVFAEYFDEIKK